MNYFHFVNHKKYHILAPSLMWILHNSPERESLPILSYILSFSYSISLYLLLDHFHSQGFIQIKYIRSLRYIPLSFYLLYRERHLSRYLSLPFPRQPHSLAFFPTLSSKIQGYKLYTLLQAKKMQQAINTRDFLIVCICQHLVTNLIYRIAFFATLT